MGLIIFLLILVFVWFFLPRILRWLTIYLVKKKARSMYEQMFGQPYTQPGRGEEPQRRRRGGWSASPVRKRKKIDPEIAEYVQFQEISVTETEKKASDDTATRSFTVEQQVSDAEWEDIK